MTGYNAPNGGTLLEATGAGSTLSLPNLSSVTVGTSGYGNRVQVQALASGSVSLPSLTQLNTGPVQFESDGANSVLSISALTSFAGSNDGTGPSLQVTHGGTVHSAALTSLNGVTLTLDGTGTLDTNQITTLAGSVLTLTGGTATFSGLTDVDSSSLEVSGGATLTLPGVTSYSVSNGSTLLEAKGAGTRIVAAESEQRHRRDRQLRQPNPGASASLVVP